MILEVPTKWTSPLTKHYNETIKPQARKLANTVKGRKTIVVHYYREVDVLVEDPARKGHWTWKPF